MKTERIKELRERANGREVIRLDASELRDLIDMADEAGRLRAENGRLVSANDQWRADAIAREQGRAR